MNGLDAAVCELIEQRTGAPARIAQQRVASGGCIHDARFLDLEDGRRFFLKVSRQPPRDVFEREAEGLEALAAVGPLRVPTVIGTSDSTATSPAFLVLEAINIGPTGKGFFEAFGHAFAELHRTAKAPRWGFEHDNYLGATAQPNGWTDSWVEFWRHRRLGHQLHLAQRTGVATDEVLKLGDQTMAKLHDLLPALEGPSLLHGDLWSGNFLADGHGQAVLIDPAAYYGHREADLAMTRLFGGFPEVFYHAYQESWPLEPGSDRRRLVYELYHLLNHLNLFGESYLPSALSHLRKLAG